MRPEPTRAAPLPQRRAARGAFVRLTFGATVTMRDADGDTFRAWLRYPGKKRPGQWGERAKDRRRRRKARAKERRMGLSRRGLFYGHDRRTACAIHDAMRRAMVAAHAKALSAELAPFLPEGVTLTFGMGTAEPA